jgi:ankyrin repeat protein
LCDGGVNIDIIRSVDGYSPLTYAAKYNIDDITSYLSLRSKRLDDEDPEKLTAFTRYLLLNKFDMATKLIARGADINYTNRDGKTALIIAI